MSDLIRFFVSLGDIDESVCVLRGSSVPAGQGGVSSGNFFDTLLPSFIVEQVRLVQLETVAMHSDERRTIVTDSDQHEHEDQSSLPEFCSITPTELSLMEMA